ncbi:hypothetical protein [Cellulophaga omnivescoria]|uniref:hypothetical protein n=1 Tax=Cellulophaga omnivescoria TaxID=1888890 RepID=UPI0009854AA0|nr:hypothetical protein [Cellulophaga omnivescoria]
MSRLNLEAFKVKAENQKQELEELSGGILGACHCTYENTANSFEDSMGVWSDAWHYAWCDDDHS